MKTEEEILENYRYELREWAWFSSQNNPMYEGAFHRVWCLAAVLEIPADRVAADMRLAQDDS